MEFTPRRAIILGMMHNLENVTAIKLCTPSFSIFWMPCIAGSSRLTRHTHKQEKQRGEETIV